MDILFGMPAYTVDKNGWVLYVAGLGETPQRRCWLPYERRPIWPASIAWHQDTLAIGAETGIVTIIRLPVGLVR